jgi:hypothetical protein
MTMSSGMYANALIRSLSNVDSVNLTAYGSIGCAIVGTAFADISANYVSTTTNVVSYVAESGTGTKGWAELATGHGYTQGAWTAGFTTPTAFSAATNKLQWPAISKSFVWTATDLTGIVQPTNAGLVVYWNVSPFPLLVVDYITSTNSATGNGATYTATWANGVFTIQIV